MPKAQPASPQPEKPRKPKAASVSQADFPAHTLEESIAVAKAIYDNYAGGPVAPHNVAIAMQLNPTGTQWRMISSAALAFGLITGGWNAERVGLTPLGRTVVAPTAEGADLEARKQALLSPKILNEFFRKYDRNKLPKDNILENILVEAGLPRDRAAHYRDLLVKTLSRSSCEERIFLPSD